MTPAEIGHRVVKAAAIQAEAWGFVRCEVPAADLTWHSSPWIHADARVNPSSVLDAADRIIAGRYDLFALEDVDLGSPPRWNRDPKTGIEAPLDFGKTLDYRDPSRVGDCKYCGSRIATCISSRLRRPTRSPRNHASRWPFASNSTAGSSRARSAWA